MQRVAVQARRHALVECCLGQHVPGDLLDREMIVGHIGVQRGDDPVAIAKRERPRTIFLIAVAIGIASQVEPMSAPALTKMRRSKQAVDHSLNGIGSLVG